MYKKTWNRDKEHYMKSDKILELARQSKNRGHEYEQKEMLKSDLLGYFFTILVGLFLFFFEYFSIKSVNLSLAALCMTATGVQTFYKGIKFKKTYTILLGIITMLLAIIFIIFSIIQVLSK